MRAWICPAYGDPSVLRIEELPAGEPGAGEVRIRLAFAGVSYPDLLSIAGTDPIKSGPPFVPGVEGAGTVIASVRMCAGCASASGFAGRTTSGRARSPRRSCCPRPPSPGFPMPCRSTSPLACRRRPAPPTSP